MNTIFFFVSVLVFALASEDLYTDKYDSIKVDDILNNKRLLESYFKCLMETGSCTPEGTELKGLIPEALTNECAKCTETQKEYTEKVIKHLTTEQHAMWEDLENKYDPEKKYQKKYSKLAHEHGIDV